MDIFRRLFSQNLPTPEKKVFISYRREGGGYIAKFISKSLRDHSYDVFMDVESLDSGTFDTILMNQIATRNHFIIILAPGTVERCANENDWVRREIEYAMDTGRNIIPVAVDNFSYEKAEPYLTGKLAGLKRYNTVMLHLDYLDEGLERIRTRFLKGKPVPVQSVNISTQEQKIVEAKIEKIATEEAPSTEELKAEYFFGIGYGLQETGDLDGAIAQYTEAIKINPDYRRAYYNRALAYQKQEDNDQAEADYRQVIRIDPTYPKGYNNLGVLLMDAGRDDEALVLLDMAIEKAPNDKLLYHNRSNLHKKMGHEDEAQADFDTFIKLSAPKPPNPNSPPPQSSGGGSYGATPNMIIPKHYPTTEPLEPLQPSYGATQPLDDKLLSALEDDNPITGNIGMVTDVGMVWSNNQDACSYFLGKRDTDDDVRGLSCFIVADGMGKSPDGEKASRLAVQIIEKHIITQLYFASDDESAEPVSTAEIIISAIQKANSAIIESLPDGGATTTVAVKIGNLVTVGHVGDTRAYLMTDGNIEQITRDHSLVQRLIELDQITQDEVHDHPQKNVLYRALGQNDNVEVDISTRRLPPNSRILICSDGLWGLVTEKDLFEITMNHSDPQQACEKLVALANTNGGRDNITVIVI